MLAIKRPVIQNYGESDTMKKCLLILLMCLFSSIAFAQGTTQKDTESQKPAEKTEVPPPARENVKAVPAAKGAAKPERVVGSGSNIKRSVPKPARNPRPVGRPVRPGRGR